MTTKYQVIHCGPVTYKWGVRNTATGRMLAQRFITKQEATDFARRLNMRPWNQS